MTEKTERKREGVWGGERGISKEKERQTEIQKKCEKMKGRRENKGKRKRSEREEKRQKGKRGRDRNRLFIMQYTTPCIQKQIKNYISYYERVPSSAYTEASQETLGYTLDFQLEPPVEVTVRQKCNIKKQVLKI